jgi:hypothetical protein
MPQPTTLPPACHGIITAQKTTEKLILLGVKFIVFISTIFPTLPQTYINFELTKSDLIFYYFFLIFD